MGELKTEDNTWR